MANKVAPKVDYKQTRNATRGHRIPLLIDWRNSICVSRLIIHGNWGHKRITTGQIVVGATRDSLFPNCCTRCCCPNANGWKSRGAKEKKMNEISLGRLLHGPVHSQRNNGTIRRDIRLTRVFVTHSYLSLRSASPSTWTWTYCRTYL